jgi:hypothetical protein
LSDICWLPLPALRHGCGVADMSAMVPERVGSKRHLERMRRDADLEELWQATYKHRVKVTLLP